MDTEILEKFNNYDMVIGVDEVGRGPIAGPVTVCAFAITKDSYINARDRLIGITDSKKITEKKRNHFTDIIRELKKEGLVHVVISSVSANIIDEKGIVPAIHSAAKTALEKVSKNAHNPFVYLDGSLFAPETYDQETIIKGDAKNWLIGAASVVAKVTRDALMSDYGAQFPNYGFENHKGYGTKAHYAAIREYGVTDIHRKSWINI